MGKIKPTLNEVVSNDYDKLCTKFFLISHYILKFVNQFIKNKNHQYNFYKMV